MSNKKNEELIIGKLYFEAVNNDLEHIWGNSFEEFKEHYYGRFDTPEEYAQNIIEDWDRSNFIPIILSGRIRPSDLINDQYYMSDMNKIKIATVPKPLEWDRGYKMAVFTKTEVFRALNTQISKNVCSYYQIEKDSKTGILYLSVIVRDEEEEYEFDPFANSYDMNELKEIAEQCRLRSIGDFVYGQVSQSEILEDMMPPLNWKNVELPAMSGLKSCMYAKILSLSKDGELYFFISQGATGRYYLELKCRLDSEDTVKEVIYTDDNLEMVLDFAKRYRLYQIAKSLTGG